jgi:drug/metabolite transporter (DMT)-like permease
MGLANDFPAISGLLIRITVALIAIWGLSIVRGELLSSVKTLHAHPRATLAMSVAAFLGPVLGVWFSLIAIQHASVGVASTLMSLTPIFLIPISAIGFKERITTQALIGTLIAMAGTALLFA